MWARRVDRLADHWERKSDRRELVGLIHNPVQRHSVRPFSMISPPHWLAPILRTLPTDFAMLTYGTYVKTFMRWVRICCLVAASAIAMEPVCGLAGSLDHLTDLTGRVQAVVTLKSRDNFTSEYRYDVIVRNLSPDAIVGDSLVIVLDKITNLAGDDREGLTGESFLKRFDVLDQDGQTDDEKPYFRVPAGTSPDLVPQTDSLPAVVRIRNRDYVAVFTPSFKVFGQKRPPPEAKRAEPSVSSTPPAPGQSAAANRNAVEKLIQLLIKKGVLTEEEWRKANQP
ncbi:MAG: hypothetical protein OJF50_006035 [Nitrospira sp.]|nr:hypothetical protein [Nitrospira sp.]